MENLHSHTIISDGKLTYEESLKLAEELGISVVAFTDHDAPPEEKYLNGLKKIKTKVKWIMGIEISAVRLEELGDRQMDLCHVLGLFIDPMNKNLMEYGLRARAARRERMERMVKNLTGLGFKISTEECVKQSKGETVGRPHIVAAMKTHEENKRVMEEWRLKMEKAAENDEKIGRDYKRMLESGEGQYPYFLFLTDRAFIPNIFVNYLDQISVDEAVKIIREAGGKAILAHYYSVQKYISPELLEELVKTKRLDGLETVCGLFAYCGPLEEEVKKSRKITKDLVRKYNCWESGGMDSHTEAEWRQFAETKWFAKETEGMVKKMVERKEVELTAVNCNFW